MSSRTKRQGMTRRQILAAATALATGGVATAVTATQALAAKLSKAEAGYRDRPRRGQRCYGCKHYFAGYCGIVEGEIHAHGWCTRFERRQGLFM